MIKDKEIQFIVMITDSLYYFIKFMLVQLVANPIASYKITKYIQ